MSKILKYLVVTHLVTIAIAVITRANPYTMLVTYSLQSILLIVMVCIQIVMTKSWASIVFGFSAAIIFGALSVATFLILLDAKDGLRIVDKSGNLTVLDVGQLVVSGLVLSAIAFAVDYIMEYFQTPKHQWEKALSKPTYAFFVFFLRGVPLILMMMFFIAMKMSDASVIAIGAIKALFDIAAIASQKLILKY